MNVGPPPRYSQMMATIRDRHAIPSNFFNEIMNVLYTQSFSTYYLNFKRRFAKSCEQLSHEATYLALLKYLLWMEECQMIFDIAEYDLHYVKLSKFTLLQSNVFTCELKIIGSNEGRPKVVMGDKIRLRVVEEDVSNFPLGSPFEIIGVISDYNLRTEKAFCIFECPFAALCQSLRYHVRFTFEHSGFIIMHDGIEIIANSPILQSRLFPNETQFNTVMKRHQFVSKERTLKTGLDRDQEAAINHILNLCYDENGVFNSQPHIIFGPPGTGKTSVLVAAIEAIIREFPSKTILAVAPSDAAADVILNRLSKLFPPGLLLRLNWWQRTLASVPLSTLPHCLQELDKFELPSYELILKYRVVVTTCGVAGCLKYLPDAVSEVRFDVVIIDEASQAPEYECYVPLSLCKQNGLMVLAGDVQQLGPAYRSPCFRTKDVHPSLQSRLLSSNLYKFLDTKINEDEVSVEQMLRSIDQEQLQTLSKPRVNKILGSFLYRNYRSHQNIFEVSSRLFYAGALRQCGEGSLVNSLVDWSNLPKDQNFPVLVHGVDGFQKSLTNSASYYNEEEAEAVCTICSSIINDPNLKERVSAMDIGVIAAFRSQVLYIRQLLRSRQLSSVNVGSVEDFQGIALA